MAPSGSRLNEIFVAQNLTDARLDVVHRLVTMHCADVSRLADVLQRNRLTQAGWTIDCHFMSQETFFASASGRKPSFLIQLSLGIPATLLSVATEIEAYLKGDFYDEVSSTYKGGLTSINSWFPWLTFAPQISADAMQMALDAALLAYLHELAHVLFGHCDYQTAQANELRALEVDADFNAGTMFALWARHLTGSFRQTSDADQTVDRLIRASFLFGTVLKALSAKSDEYHFPSVRTECFFAGATFAIEREGGAPRLSKDALAKFWINRRDRIVDPLVDALRSSSLAYFAGTEADLRDDIEAFGSITFPVRTRLKDDVLCKFRIPV